MRRLQISLSDLPVEITEETDEDTQMCTRALRKCFTSAGFVKIPKGKQEVRQM